MKLELKDRVYKLTRGKSPLSCIIPSRSSKRRPLLYFDEEQGVNRALRYARNQKSPFEDEQDGSAIIEPIIFENGMLSVPKNNPALQQFLHYHPYNGKKFVEVDYGKDAQEEVDQLNIEIDALAAAKEMSVEELEVVGRVVLSKDISTMTTSELRRDVMVFARVNPEMFMNAINDPEAKMKSTVKMFFESKLLSLRNNGRDVYFNLDGNKKRMCIIPFGANHIEYLAEWFESDEGLDIFEFLEKNL